MNSNTPEILLHLTPADPEPLRDQIARQLKARIVRGELKAGEALPGYRQLARRHRVAPSTVEAAYGHLVTDGLIAGEPTEEVTVAELEPDRRRELVERQQLERLVAQELGRRELEMARDVQRRLLPPSTMEGPGWQVFARCLPARVVAGDFYDVLRRPDNGVDVIVADVAGKGFAASLIMASVKAMLPFVSAKGSAADLLTQLNARLSVELGRGEFVALTVARYSPAAGHVELANAGAPDPYLLVPGRAPEPISVPGPRLPLGIRSEVAYSSKRLPIDTDSRLMLLTDGLPEARDPSGDPMGYGELEAMIADEAPTGSPSAWLARLFDRVHQRTGRAPEDDWTAAMLLPGDGEEAP